MSSHSERGFTLVELVVVSLLLALLASLIYGTLNGITRTKRALESERSITHAAQSVIGRMTRELTNIREEPLSAPQQQSQGADADPDEFDAYVVGTDGNLAEGAADTLRFVSAGTGQVMFSGQQNNGIVEITYRLQENQQGRPVLVREEQPAGDVDKALRTKQRIVFPLAENVVSLNFRYRRRGRWLNEWSLGQTGTPEALELTLGIIGDDGRREDFRTSFSLQFERQDPNNQ